MATHIPGNKWREVKQELLSKWHELTERDVDRTRGNVQSIVDLLENKVGMAIEDASERFSEIASRYHLYDEPEEVPEDTVEKKKERVLELKPKKPANRDRKPKDAFRA